ncbi:hypothetical protein [Nesterenkonia sp.]|uniref:ribbon-helix-helix protein n=1 Tax=Nesterenkonia sp. TaxID=704201 RepID=UPI00260D95F9|nr:hypothetical protein [Nesterenkonia sp.]
MSTTIKVSPQLRERINRDAQEQGVTAAGLIEMLLDERERQQRMRAFGRAVSGADQDYWDEMRHWDTALEEGSRGD